MKGHDFQKNIISAPALDMPEIKCLGTTFFNKMLENKDEIAQIDGITGEKETFGFLLQKCIRTAIKMRSKGLTPNDILSICSFNHLNACVPFLAGLFLGIKAASLDPTISLTDTIHLIKQVRPRIIFAGPEAVQLIEKALEESHINSEIVVFGETTKHLEFSEFLEPSPEEQDFLPLEVNVEEIAAIFFSSGTTGLPKGICLSHYAVLAYCYQNNTYIIHGDISLAFSSMYWISSLVTIMHCLMNVAARLIYPKFNPEEVWNLVTKYKVSMLFLAPSQIISMCKNGHPKDADISSLRFILTGGGPLAGKQIKALRKCLKGTVISKAWGQTELSGGGTIFRFADDEEHRKMLLEKPESSGKPIPGLTYKVVDTETEEILGPHQPGELRVKSKFQMVGYCNMDSSNCWDSDGFLKTGDVAYYDEDHCFYIVDRIKEMLKFQSWHVPPAKIEEVLLTHPFVQDAVVIGLSHPEDGDHPMGVVVLKELAVGKVTEQEIAKFVEERVDDRQRLRGGVKFVERIPLTPTGKTSRQLTKKLILQGAI